MKKLIGSLFVQQPYCKIFPKKNSLYAAVISCKKSEKFHVLTLGKTCKFYFGLISGPILAQQPQNEIFSTVTLCKNEKNSECPFFMKLEKPNFGPVYTPFGQKTTEQELHGLYMVWNPSNIWVRKATEILSHSFWSWVLVQFQFLGEHYRLGNVFSFFTVGRLS